MQDPESVPAWVARGESFLAMGNPLIAGLHFDRALTLDPTCEKAAAHKKTLRMWDAERTTVGDVGAASGDAASQGGSGSRLGISEASTPGCVNSSSIAKSGSNTISGPVEEVGLEDTVDSCGKAEREREEVLSEGGRDREAAAVPLPAVLSTTGNSSAGSGGRDGEVGGTGLRSSSARSLLVKACEEYREGAVLHQEAFLMSSSVKFKSVLMHLDQVESMMSSSTSAGPTIAQAAAEGREGAEGVVSEGSPVVRPGDCGVGVGDSSGESTMKNVRVACHLNIAAAALLRQRDYKVAVEHCNRRDDCFVREFGALCCCVFAHLHFFFPRCT